MPVPSDDELALVVRTAEKSFEEPMDELDRAIVRAVREYAILFPRDPEASVICAWVRGWYERAAGD